MSEIFLRRCYKLKINEVKMAIRRLYDPGKLEIFIHPNFTFELFLKTIKFDESEELDNKVIISNTLDAMNHTYTRTIVNDNGKKVDQKLKVVYLYNAPTKVTIGKDVVQSKLYEYISKKKSALVKIPENLEVVVVLFHDLTSDGKKAIEHLELSVMKADEMEYDPITHYLNNCSFEPEDPEFNSRQEHVKFLRQKLVNKLRYRKLSMKEQDELFSNHISKSQLTIIQKEDIIARYFGWRKDDVIRILLDDPESASPIVMKYDYKRVS